MRFLTKFALALVLPAFVPVEPFPPLVTVTYGAAGVHADGKAMTKGAGARGG